MKASSTQKQFSLRLPPQLLATIERLADKAHLTPSSFVRKLLFEAVERQK